MEYWQNVLLAVVRRLTVGTTIILPILPIIQTHIFLVYYFLIILDTQTWNIIYIIYFVTFYHFYSLLFKKIHLIFIFPDLYLYYKPTINVSHIITYTSDKYENKHSNIYLELGLMGSYKMENTGLYGIALR